MSTTKDRSYRVRLSGGERVELIEPHGHVAAGSRGTVIGADSNAGFRGIEAAVRWDDGHESFSVSTGVLRVLDVVEDDPA